MAQIGAWAFITGLVIAVLLGLFTGTPGAVTLTILVVLGLIVGFLNVTDTEVQGFLLASVALLIVGSAANISVVPLIGDNLEYALNGMVLFIAPATLVVAIKEIFLVAKNK